MGPLGWILLAKQQILHVTQQRSSDLFKKKPLLHILVISSSLWSTLFFQNTRKQHTTERKQVFSTRFDDAQCNFFFSSTSAAARFHSCGGGKPPADRRSPTQAGWLSPMATWQAPPQLHLSARRPVVDPLYQQPLIVFLCARRRPGTLTKLFLIDLRLRYGTAGTKWLHELGRLGIEGSNVLVLRMGSLYSCIRYYEGKCMNTARTATAD